MTFLHSAFQLQHSIDPLSRSTLKVGGTRVDAMGGLPDFYKSTTPKTPVPAPLPDPNQALNQSQAAQDQMRARRGLLANIFAGGAGGGGAPQVGNQTLGT